MDQADIVIAHNGKRFDVPKNEFKIHSCWTTPNFSLYSDRYKRSCSQTIWFLVQINLTLQPGYFNIEHKDDTDFDLWKRCIAGDQEALDYMETYNRKDVLILEQVYLKLRPWIKNHPNIGLYLEEDNMVCPTCGSNHLVEDNTFHYTSVNKYKVMRCIDCGAISRLRTTSYPKDKKEKFNNKYIK